MVSKSPGGVNEPLDGNIIISFSDEWGINTSTLSMWSDSPDISIDLQDAVWSDNGFTVTVPYTTTAEGEEFTVNFGVKDLAGNVINDSLSFTTLVKPTSVVINSPSAGGSYVQGDPIVFSVTVTGTNDLPVRGAVVSVSGGCSTTLTEETPGVYTGSCSSSDYGDIEFVVSAVNGGQEANSTVTLSIAKAIGLTVKVLEPQQFTFTRGDSIPVKVRVLADDQPVNNAVVSSEPSINFSNEGNGVYSGVLESNYFTPTSLNLRVTASAVVSNQSRTTTTVITLGFAPVSLNVVVKVLGNGEEKPVLDGGDEVTVKVTAYYPDGSAADLREVNGTLTARNALGAEENILLTFSKSGDYWIAEPNMTVKNTDSSFEASVSVKDAYGNTGTGTTVANGPVKGLKFEVEEPKSLVFARGQKVKIRGRVYSELEKAYVNAVVWINNKSMQKQGEYFVAEYLVPVNDSSKEKDLVIRMKYGDIIDYQVLKLTVTDSLQTAVSNNNTIRAGEALITIAYPDGSPVTDGNFSLVIGNKTYALEKKGNSWVALVDLGPEPLHNIDAKVMGQDVFGNKIESSVRVDYEPPFNLLWFLKKNSSLIFTLISALFLAFVFNRKVIKPRRERALKRKKAMQERKKVREKYKELKKKMVKADWKIKEVETKLLARRIDEKTAHDLKAELEKEKIEINEEIAELEAHYPFLKAEEKAIQGEVNLELAEEQKTWKEKVAEDIKISKIVSEVRKMREWGKPEEEIKSIIIKKYGGELGEKAIDECYNLGILKKTNPEEEIITSLRKLLKAGVPEKELMKDLIDNGLSKDKAKEFLKKAKGS